MIQISELRIGNLIQEGKVEQIDNSIDEIYYSGDGYYLSNYCCNLNAIPLTKEWLLKFGFFKYNNAYVLEKPNENTMDFSFSVWQDMTYNSSEFPVKLDYVHQLQNLYFALIGSELQVVAQAVP